MKLTLEALQAADGDCLLLHHERKGAAAGSLVDGGSRASTRTMLRKRLDELRGNAPLDLRMLMVSHIDSDHVTGLVDMLRARWDARTRVPASRSAGSHAVVQLLQRQLTGGKTAAVQSATVGAALKGVAPRSLEPWEGGGCERAAGPRLTQLRDAARDSPQSGAGDLVKAENRESRKSASRPGSRLSFSARTTCSWTHSMTTGRKPSSSRRPVRAGCRFSQSHQTEICSIVVLVKAERGAGKKPISMLLTGDAGGDPSSIH